MSKVSIIKKIWRKNSPIFLWQISGIFPSNPFFKPTDPWIGNKARGKTLFLNHPLSISEEYWNNFDWLRDLKESENYNYRKRGRELYLDWISKNYKWNENSWSPTILSNRLTNILLCYKNFAETADDDFQDNLMNHFARQSRCLEIDCEMIKNIQEKFICLCGLLAGRIGLTEIEDEIKIILEKVTQNSELLINRDGMHVSRQPQKHFQVLKKLIEVRNLSSNFKSSYGEKLNSIINKMILSGKIIRHSNGLIADFNNGCNYESFLIDQIFNKFKSSSILNKFSEDGYINVKSKNSNFIFDCGPPETNWVNFHSGTLSFEFCYAKQMIIINCGSIINDEKWTNSLKGTSAHSTINIDNFNSTSVVENNNRIANIIKKSAGKTESGFFVEASHDGYSKSHGIMHQRRLEINNNGNSLNGIDNLIYMDGFSKIPLEANVCFHLSPKIKVSKVLGGDVLLRLPNKEGWFFRTNLNMVYLENSVKVENLNIQKTKQIIVTIPLLDLKNRGSKSFEWKLFKN